VGLTATVLLSLGVATAHAAPTYVSTPFGEALRHPLTLDFAADGDLIGQHLSWHAWGSPATVAYGRLQFRTTPSRFVYRYGSLTLYGRKVLCPGSPFSYYYARARFHVTGSPFGPLRSQSLDKPTEHFDCQYEQGPGQ
jgi:hypothetical protein